VVFSFLVTRTGIVPVTLPKDFILNSPFIITAMTVMSCQIWLLVGAAVAGEAAARDVHTGIHPLMYTSSVTKGEYLFGRFIAALILNAGVLLGVQIGSILAAYAPGISREIIGPFRPGAYLTAFILIGISNAFIGTTAQFLVALRTGRPIAAYAGSLGLFFLSYPLTVLLFLSRLSKLGLWRLTDAIGVFAIMNEMMSNWTIAEKNVRPFVLEGMMLWNRIMWIAIALALLGAIYLTFRFAHRTALTLRLGWLTRRFRRRVALSDDERTTPVTVPAVHQSFGAVTGMHQVLSIAKSSFWMLAKSPAGLFLLAVFPFFVGLVITVQMEHWGVPLLPRTGYVLTKYVMASLKFMADYRVIVPLLMIYYVGELIWRERDARVNETMDAAPVREWVLFAGKYLGLALLLAGSLVIVTIAVMVAQLTMGYHHFEIGLSLAMLFGLQLPEYLIFGVLIFTINSLVNQKYVGMLLSIAAYVFIVFSSFFHVEHNLLVYGAGAQWSYTGMRGLGSSVAPWLWFKLYWAAWALLLAVAARLFWVRGLQSRSRTRFALARLRFTPATAKVAGLAAGLIVVLGGFIFYNTNVLNEYRTDKQSIRRQADYERRYGKYEHIAQPQPAETKLNVEVYPQRGTAEIAGSYRLVNRGESPIDSIHLETPSFVTTQLTFNRPATRVLSDDDLGHFIYALQTPLAPGDSVTLNFNVKIEPRGFGNNGAIRAVVKNGSYFTGAILPVIGYQPRRELTSADDRRAEGLPRQITLPTPDDVDPTVAAGPESLFDATVSTDMDQIAVAPGELRRTWTDSGRRYFHYKSDIPLAGLYVFFSADYAVHRERWGDVDVQFFTSPRDTAILDRIRNSARASLDYYGTQFGPYPYGFLQFIEQPSNGLGMGVDGSGVVTELEGSFLLNPRGDRLDAISEIVAHEMAHQWWGVQLKYAFAEGAVLLSESLAWYSGMQVVKRTRGRERLRQFMHYLREPYPWPPMRTGLPLLRAMDPYAGYRRGPFAFYALSEYIGEDKLNTALRNLLQKKGFGRSSLATTADLYTEMKAVTPDSLKPLLHDLFEVNTYWHFNTKRASAVKKGNGWEVTFDIEARKVHADSAGAESEAPFTELVELGVFAPAEQGQILGKPIYLGKHRMRQGQQTITVFVSESPARGGIDPYNLLDWEEGDNIEGIATSVEADR
ncbi:MAG TPA: hypothetical protein VF042_14375, partial [Gemmatimonadaceae bacterium]